MGVRVFQWFSIARYLDYVATAVSFKYSEILFNTSLTLVINFCPSNTSFKCVSYVIFWYVYSENIKKCHICSHLGIQEAKWIFIKFYSGGVLSKFVSRI
jgi:hypothetical protein